MGMFDNFMDPAKTTTQTNQMPNWNTMQAANFGQLGATALQEQQNPTQYPKNLYAQVNPWETSYFNYASQIPQDQAKTQAALESAFQPVGNIGTDWAEKYWNESVQPMLQRQWEQQTLPQLQESMAGPQWWSQARADAVQRAFTERDQNWGSQHAKLLYDEELARRTAEENAKNRAAIAANQNLYIGNQAMQGAATMARTADKEQIAGELQKYLMGGSVNGVSNQIYNPANTLAMSILGLSPFSYQNTTTSTGAGTGYGALTGSAGGLGGWAGPTISSALGTVGSGLSSAANSAWDWAQELLNTPEEYTTDYDYEQPMWDYSDEYGGWYFD